MSINKMIGGILAGAAAGLVIGYIVSPDKTKRKINHLSGKGNDYLAVIQSRFKDFLDDISDAVETAEDEKDKLFAVGKSNLHQVKREVKSALDGQSM